MLRQLSQWYSKYRNRRSERLMPERQVVVTCDAEACNVVYPGGDIESVLWNDLERVEIHTNDSGPWFADVWWVLVGKSSQCSYPLGATGETEALERLQQLQGFDNEAVGKAMQCTDNARFLCWERVGPLPTPPTISV